MSRTIRTSRHRADRALLAIPSLALAVTLAACGGSSAGGTGSGSSSATGPATPGASSPATTPAPSLTGMGGMTMPPTPTNPPVMPGPAAVGAHNDADVRFATDMLPHHGQAVVMADLILARSSNAQVKALAESIKKTQAAEIATVSGWLEGWGEPLPDPYGHAAGMPGMSHGGMMSDAQLKQLSGAMGTAADRSFLSMMIEHHQGAIDQARRELGQGVNPEAKKLAQSIVTGQTAEITRMKSLLVSLR